MLEQIRAHIDDAGDGARAAGARLSEAAEMLGRVSTSCVWAAAALLLFCAPRPGEAPPLGARELGKEALGVDAGLPRTLLARCEGALCALQPQLAPEGYPLVARAVLQLLVALCIEGLACAKRRGEADLSSAGQLLLHPLGAFAARVGLHDAQAAPDGPYLNPLRLLLELGDADDEDFAPQYATLRAKHPEVSAPLAEALLERGAGRQAGKARAKEILQEAASLSPAADVPPPKRPKAGEWPPALLMPLGMGGPFALALLRLSKGGGAGAKLQAGFQKAAMLQKGVSGFKLS
jgi:hypothetical protein